MERRVLAQTTMGIGEVDRTDRPARQLGQLGVDPGDLGEADLVDLRRGQVRRRVRPDERGVRRLPARHGAEARGVVRTGVGKDDVGEEVPIPNECRSDPRRHGLGQPVREALPLRRGPRRPIDAERIEQRPVVVRATEEVVELVDDPMDRRSGRDQALREGLCDVGADRIDP